MTGQVFFYYLPNTLKDSERFADGVTAINIALLARFFTLLTDN
jgi:hypothetical protein